MLPTRSCIKFTKANCIGKCDFILKSCSRSRTKHRYPFFLIRSINTNNVATSHYKQSLDNESEDILSMALKEENMDCINQQQTFESARKERNEKLVKTRRGLHIETYFNKTLNIQIPTIWISIKEFMNLRMILKAYYFKDGPYGIIMKHVSNSTLKLNLIENYTTKIPLKHAISIKDIIIDDFKDIINKNSDKCVVELSMNTDQISLIDIKYILQDLGDYSQRVLLVEPLSLLSLKICRDIMINHEKSQQKPIDGSTLIYKLKLNGVNVPQQIITNLRTENQIYDNIHFDIFEEHPIAWLINNFYHHFYLKYSANGKLQFAVNYRFLYNKQPAPETELKSQVINNIKQLITSRQRQGLSLQYFLGSYRKQFGEFPRNSNQKTLRDLCKEANIFVAYYPQEISAVRMFINRFMYFENIKLGIKNHCDNKNYDGYMSTKKLHQIFGIQSMTFLTNFFNDFEFVTQWNSRNGARDIYIKQLSNKRHLKQINKNNIIYGVDVFKLFCEILHKNNGYLFLSELNNEFMKQFGAIMDARIIIHKYLAKHSNIHYLPWNYSFSETSTSTMRAKDKYSLNYCDQILFDINHENISPIVQIPILVKLFRYDFDHSRRLLTKNPQSKSIWSQSTNYRDHFVTHDSFTNHLKNHAKLKHAQNLHDWSTFLTTFEQNDMLYYGLNHNVILDTLRTTFMGQTIVTQTQTQTQTQTASVSVPVSEEPVKPQQDIDTNEIYHRLDSMVSSFESKLDKVWLQFQDKSIASSDDNEFGKTMIDDHGHLQLTGSSFLNKHKSATSKQSLSVFGEDTLKAMLLDCCKSGFSKPAINIAVYMASNDMLCNTEHYIGLMRIQYEKLATQIWNEMMQRHFISSTTDSFSVTINTFQLMRQALDDGWFRSLLLQNVHKLSTNVEDEQNQEIMLIFLKYIQEYSQENLAEWFSYHSKINQRSLNSEFWKKAALMLAVVFSKNASKINHTSGEYNRALQQCLDPWCNDIELLNKNKNKSSLHHPNLNSFVAQQLEHLIMRISNSSQLINVNSLKKLLKLYSNTCLHSPSHIVRDRLQNICLTVLQQQKQESYDYELMKLLEASRLNTELFLKIYDCPEVEDKIYEKALPELWNKKELLFESLANKGDVTALLSAIESRGNKANINTNKSKQHLIFLRESINKFLNNCTDINLAFVMMDKLLRSPTGQKVMNFAYFLRMVDIGINNISQTSHWFQIKNLLQLLLDSPYKTIWQIDIYEKLIIYCLAHSDIVGLTDALQMLFDWLVDNNADLTQTQKLSSQLFEQIMEFTSNKSSDAALHLFQRLSQYSEKATFRCLYFVLRACANNGDQIGVETVLDLMVANDINKQEWNTDIYNAIIKCNSFDGGRNAEKSLALFHELLSADLQPNIDTFDALLSHGNNIGNTNISVEYMLNQINEMKYFNIKPSQNTFSIILQFCANHKHKEIALKLLEMINDLPFDEKTIVINNKCVWLHYIQCFESFDEISYEINQIFKAYSYKHTNINIAIHFLTNNMFEYISSVIYNKNALQENEDSLFSLTVVHLRKFECLIENIIHHYHDADDENTAISLEMNGFCKVFDGIYKIDKSLINQTNIESATYNLSQIDAIFWRYIKKMKDLNIFFPDPDLLKPYLYLKDIELECYELSQTSKDKYIYEHITDGIFEFIECGIFVSPELIDDLCQNIGIEKNRTDTILEAYNHRRKYQQNLRLKQPLPHFSF